MPKEFVNVCVGHGCLCFDGEGVIMPLATYWRVVE